MKGGFAQNELGELNFEKISLKGNGFRPRLPKIFRSFEGSKLGAKRAQPKIAFKTRQLFRIQTKSLLRLAEEA